MAPRSGVDRMHIGLIIYGRLDTMSGGYLYDRKLVEYLRQAGDEVTLVSLPWSNYARHLTHNGSFRLYRQLRDAPFDVLLQDELNHPSLFWLNRRLRRHVHYPIVGIVHHLRCSEVRPAWQNRFYRWVERRYLMTLDGFIYNSQTTAAVVLRLIGQRGPTPSIVAYPAGNRFISTLNPATITTRAQQNDLLRLLFVGNVTSRKGLHLLLSALKLLPAAKWHLDIVGSQDVEPAYVRMTKEQAQQAQLTHHLTWHGKLSDAALAKRFAQSDVLVVPSSYEGFGIVYLEGMAFGLPAIATTSGAAHELITHGHNGFLVPPEQPTVLAEHLQTLLQNRPLLAQMSLAAHERFQRHPTWAESMAKIRDFLQRFPAPP